jgi:hypothetical protein
MSNRPAATQQRSRSLAALPDSWHSNLVAHLSPASRLALRATCQHFLHICDMQLVPEQQQQLLQTAGTGPNSTAASGQQKHQQQQQDASCRAQLVLALARRQPSLWRLHGLGLLKQVCVCGREAEHAIM